MSKKRILGGSIVLTLAAAIAVAVLVAGSVAVTPTQAEAGPCFFTGTQQAWGHGSSCAAALTDLQNQAYALCDDCPYVGSCGAGPAVTNKTSCYFAAGKWTIDADISNYCTVNIQQCIDLPGGP